MPRAKSFQGKPSEIAKAIVAFADVSFARAAPAAEGRGARQKRISKYGRMYAALLGLQGHLGFTKVQLRKGLEAMLEMPECKISAEDPKKWTEDAASTIKSNCRLLHQALQKDASWARKCLKTTTLTQHILKHHGNGVGEQPQTSPPEAAKKVECEPDEEACEEEDREEEERTHDPEVKVESHPVPVMEKKPSHSTKTSPMASMAMKELAGNVGARRFSTAARARRRISTRSRLASGASFGTASRRARRPSPGR